MRVPASSTPCRHDGVVKERYLRVGDELRDDESIVVRGGELIPDVLRTDAARCFAIYGVYGISVFAPLDDLDSGVTRLCACEHEVRVNPYHED